MLPAEQPVQHLTALPIKNIRRLLDYTLVIDLASPTKPVR
jgi:hypothetical protein